MSESLSATLRRLHEEARENEVLSRRGERARRTIDDALPALADLVEETEAEYAGHREGCTCTMHGLLAALRERLGAKP